MGEKKGRGGGKVSRRQFSFSFLSFFVLLHDDP